MDSKIKLISGSLQLATGISSIAATFLLIVYGIYPQELTVLYFQMALATTGLVNILLGLETLLLTSKEKNEIRISLIFDLLSSGLFGILLLVTGHKFGNVYLGSTIMESEPELWDDIVISVYKLCWYLGNFATIILIIRICLSSFLVYKNLEH